MSGIYKQFAEKFKDVDDLIIGEIDVNANDGLKFETIPTLKFYPANNKIPITFTGDITLENLIEFIKNPETHVQKIELEEDIDDDYDYFYDEL